MTDQDLRPPSQQRRASRASTGHTGKWVMGAVALAAALAAGWWAYQRKGSPAPVPVAVSTPAAPSAPPAAPAVAPAEPVAEAAPAQAAQPETGQPLHPIVVDAETAVTPDDAAALEVAVSEWLGRENTLKFVALQGLAHHIAATVDNLPRSHAAPRLWPLSPVGGRMVITEDDNGMHIAAANASRYDALAGFVKAVDPVQAAALYRKVYPALQQAYENLGYPGKHFNDRMVQVIDHLLQTPQVNGPLRVKLVQVQIPGQAAAAPQQPWLRYEYADPQLQSLSAGQRILLRLGPAHAQTVQAQLRALRGQLASATPQQ